MHNNNRIYSDENIWKTLPKCSTQRMKNIPFYSWNVRDTLRKILKALHAKEINLLFDYLLNLFINR